MTTIDPTPAAFFKDLKLGDYLSNQRPNLGSSGKTPEEKNTVSGAIATFNRRGPGFSYVVEVAGSFNRSHLGVLSAATPESDEQFLQRLFAYQLRLKRAVDIWPAGGQDESGIVAGTFDQRQIYKLDNTPSPGANVQLALATSFGATLPLTSTAGELWYIFEQNTGVHELFLAVGDAAATHVTADVLVGTYVSAFLFRAAWAYPAVFLDPTIVLGGDQEEEADAVKDVPYKFTGVDDPRYGVIPP